MAVKLLLSAVVTACLWQAEPVDSPPALSPVALVRLEGPLAEAWTARLQRAHHEALTSGCTAFFLELDTPGGEVELMKRLGDQLDAIATDFDLVCFVNDHAWSAGAFLAAACPQIYMDAGASIGAATPVSAAPGIGMLPIPEEDGLREKILSAFRGEFRSWAQAHDREPSIAEAFVDPSVIVRRVVVDSEERLVTDRAFQNLLEQGARPRVLEVVCAEGDLLVLSPSEAVAVGWCEGQVESREALFAQLGWDGRPVLLWEANWSEALVETIGAYSWLLLLAAGFFFVVAFNLPGLGGPELLAVLCLVAFLFHGQLVGLAEWTEILLVLLGLALLALEVFVLPGTFVAGTMGAVMLAFGILLSMQGFVVPDGTIEWGMFRGNLAVVLGVALFVPVLGVMAIRRLTTTRMGGRLVLEGPTSETAATLPPDEAAVLPGMIGVADSVLRPAGRIRVGEAVLDAHTSGDWIDAGTPVRITRMEGPRALVEPLPGETD